ncbi:MAG TPA: TetR/AcrR family transcriptional regulator [Ensifer sp.]|jgi:AcrR family transcriptional regulator|uniref:TetR/AcrR family transcriptional regulator n=1 Tax=Ensifer sp. TaxID=1872086 RepID=UPI002E141472|nr:TetR/AcrR family transcriptional regulator [Ensifer sp.]
MTTDFCKKPRRSPRERIIEAARDLFRRNGIRGTGVDAIADAADSNKMTLYRHFNSKDELIVECLYRAGMEMDGFWQELEEAHPGDGLMQLRTWVRSLAAHLDDDSCHCEMMSAAVQLTDEDHPGRSLIRTFKDAQRDRVVALCHKAGIADAELLTDTLLLLIEGARATQKSSGVMGPSARFAEIADAAILSFAKGDIGIGRRA